MPRSLADGATRGRCPPGALPGRPLAFSSQATDEKRATMPVVAHNDIKALLRQTADEINDALGRRLANSGDAPPRLAEAMRYSLDAGGKRIRPALVLLCCEVCGGQRHTAMPAALAVECVHTFSLIHDDLPALDDDDLRRGRPSSHVRFDEATAILAGDGLLALAFEIIAAEIEDAALAISMVKELAAATGWQGMIGGEAADIEAESVPPEARLVGQIHAAKTARLISTCCRLGAMAAGADDRDVSALGTYGQELGLAFQAVDDILDVTANSDALGKRTGKDAAAGKQSYARAVGVSETRVLAAAAVDRALRAIDRFGSRASQLVMLAQFVVARGSEGT